MQESSRSIRPPRFADRLRADGPAMGEVAANVARAGAWSNRPPPRGARLVVLPELANTGYMFESREEACALAETVPDGPSARAWIALAQRLGIHLVPASPSATAAGSTTLRWSPARKAIWAPTASCTCGATRTCISNRATWACRCSTPSSAGWAWPSATTAG